MGVSSQQKMVRVQRDEGYGAIPRSENVVRKRHLVLTGLAVTLCCALVAAAVITSSPSDPSFDEYQELAAAAPASGSGGLPTYADRQKGPKDCQNHKASREAHPAEEKAQARARRFGKQQAVRELPAPRRRACRRAI